MSEIMVRILAKALLVALEALIAKLAVHLMRSMRYRQGAVLIPTA
jgi:hypothetical protein